MERYEDLSEANEASVPTQSYLASQRSETRQMFCPECRSPVDFPKSLHGQERPCPNYTTRIRYQPLVMALPLQEFWDTDGPVHAVRERYLCRVDVESLLESGTVRFAIGGGLTALSWIPPDKSHAISSDNIARRLVLAPQDEEYSWDSEEEDPNTFFVASLWNDGEEPPIVLLEYHH